MLAAVRGHKRGIEFLSGYIQDAASPVGVPRSLPPFPGAPTQPGAAVPGVRGLIPNSSQRPTRQTNVPIVYTRVTSSAQLDFLGRSPVPDPARAHTPVFVCGDRSAVGRVLPDHLDAISGLDAVNAALRSDPDAQLPAATWPVELPALKSSWRSPMDK